MPWPKGKPVPRERVLRQIAARKLRRIALGITPAARRGLMSFGSVEAAWIERFLRAVKQRRGAEIDELLESEAILDKVLSQFARMNKRNAGPEEGFVKSRVLGPVEGRPSHETMVSLYKDGFSGEVIARRLGVHKATVCRVVRESKKKRARARLREAEAAE